MSTEMRWRKTTKKTLPKEGDEILCYWDTGLYNTCFYKDGHWQMYQDGNKWNEMKAPNYWMPLVSPEK